MKRIIAAILLIATCLSLFGCGIKHENTNEKETEEIEKQPVEVPSDPVIKIDDFEVTMPMMTYFYISDFYNVYNQYGQYFSYMGFDPTTSMASQQYDEETTWFDYFTDTAVNNTSMYLYYAQAAKDAGFEVELDTLADEQIEALTTAAQEYGVDLTEYLTQVFGNKVSEADARDAIKLTLYASKYYEKITDDYSSSLTDKDYKDYYSENGNTVNMVDYRSYTISSSAESDADEATKNTAYAEAKAEAELLKTAATSSDGFVAWVKSYLTEMNTGLDTPLTEDEIKAKAEAVSTGIAYTEGSEMHEWAFSSERKVGDVEIFDDGAGNYTVCMLEKTAYRDESPTKDVRHILIMSGTDEENKAKAEAILESYLAGEKTAEAFDALAQVNNEDSNALYENVPKGRMVAEFENWIFDETRVEGDTGIVKTQYGYHVMYFEGDGLEQWKTGVQSAMLEKHLADTYALWQEKYTVDVDDSKLPELPDTIPQPDFNTEAVEE